jgi:adenosylcobinamide amidohydrolase
VTCLKEFRLAAKGVKLVLEENVLALVSDAPLTTVGSAIHNGGGLKKTRIIANTQVTDEYGDLNLHNDPEAFVMQAYKKLGLDEEFVGMVTYAIVQDFALVTKSNDGISVSVVATAGCTHAESSGEEITVQKIEGTINIMVLIDGNPCDSCLVSCIITATEAKTAALRELDIRSRYSGDAATGTITDAMVVAKTNRGPEVLYGGPASNLGHLVGYCTRKAVKEAVMKGKVGGFVPGRSLVKRLEERGFSIERLASELAKVNGLSIDAKALAESLTSALEGDAIFASVVFAAVKLDEDLKAGLIPPQLREAKVVSKGFGEFVFGQDSKQAFSSAEDCGVVNLPPFLKGVLVSWLRRKTENLK